MHFAADVTTHHIIYIQCQLAVISTHRVIYSLNKPYDNTELGALDERTVTANSVCQESLVMLH